MLGTERQKEIINYIRLHGTVSVQKLTSLVFASEATIRRDLNQLEKMGLIRRVFGGATISVSADTQIPLFVREQEQNQEKFEICRKASELINDGRVLFIDGSSTCQHLIPFLSKFNELIVITNGLKIAAMLYELHIKTYCTGGKLLEGSSVFTGKDTLSFIDRFNTDMCFISSKGIDLNGRISDTSEEEVELRRHVIANARSRILLMTDKKIGTSYIHTLCDSNEIDAIITNGTLPDSIKTRETSIIS